MRRKFDRERKGVLCLRAVSMMGRGLTMQSVVGIPFYPQREFLLENFVPFSYTVKCFSSIFKQMSPRVLCPWGSAVAAINGFVL